MIFKTASNIFGEWGKGQEIYDLKFLRETIFETLLIPAQLYLQPKSNLSFYKSLGKTTLFANPRVTGAAPYS